MEPAFGLADRVDPNTHENADYGRLQVSRQQRRLHRHHCDQSSAASLPQSFSDQPLAPRRAAIAMRSARTDLRMILITWISGLDTL